LDREAAEVLDPDHERSMIIEDGRAVISPGQVLENLHQRMERLDLDPDTTWSPEELMSLDETAVMFPQLRMGEMVIIETAWYARQILSRWPAELVEHPIAPEARLNMFMVDPVTIEDQHQDAGRRILNRSLASADQVQSHPELEDLSAEDLVNVWLALVFWFGIKSGMLNQHARGGPTRP